MPTVADNIVATLRASGVRRIYGIPGDSLSGFTDALRRNGDIAWEHVRHNEIDCLRLRFDTPVGSRNWPGRDQEAVVGPR